MEPKGSFKSSAAVNNNHTINTFSKRSVIMSSLNQFARVFMVVAMVSLIGGLVFGQTFTNNGTFNNNASKTSTFTNYTNGASGTTNNLGTMNVKASLTQSAAAANFKTSTGTVGYTGDADQTVLPGSSIDQSTYGALNFTSVAAHNKDLSADVTVAGGIDASGSATFRVLSSSSLTVTRTGSAIFTTAGSGAHSFTGGTVIYNRATSAQTVYPATYGGLTMSGGGGSTKTAAGTVTVNGALTVNSANTFAVGGSGSANLTMGASGTITNAGTLDQVDENGQFNASAVGNTITNTSGLIKIAGAASLYTTTPPTIDGTVTYYSNAAAQAIGVANYLNLDLANNGAKSFSGVEYKVRKDFTIAGASPSFAVGNIFHYSGTSVEAPSGQTVAALTGYKEIKFSNDSDKNINGTVTATAMTVTSSVTSTNGVYVQSSGVVTINGNVTNDGTVTNDGSITVN